MSHSSCCAPPNNCGFNPSGPEFCTDLQITAFFQGNVPINGFTGSLYFILVQNNGPITATNVVYTATFTGQFAGHNGFTPATAMIIDKTIRIAVGTMPVGAVNMDFIFVLEPPSGGSILANVISATPDCNYANNSSSASSSGVGGQVSANISAMIQARLPNVLSSMVAEFTQQ
jgi:hypothetical protein